MTRTAPPTDPEAVGERTRSGRLSAELVDIDADGWRIYRVSDERGYTHHHDTLRIGAEWRGEGTSRGRELVGVIQVWRRQGWTDLATYDNRDGALARAFRVLYGEEDHG